MEWIHAHWADVWVIITSVVTIASVIAKLTPNEWDDHIVSKIISLLALGKK